MYTVTKRLEISASHQLTLDYPSKCQHLHGHNWIVTVHARSETLDHNGMVIDFTIIKEKIHGRLDHQHINDVMGDINPTAENMAKWIADQLGSKCFKVEVQESEGNVAIYERS
ncbi:6-carboxytetrahydropterin synthase QueD [Veillonella caviae]|uniref:6-carboxytetrahydropterin synthase QueD n=1 Tax=Veillonella caviae TaxID=248316 RepID=UPI0023A80418|nr:6-carboxytetrahydropterin synthase QueD [Veillonella caviae]MCI5709116.1 6-carboxytetrahydropterin synthase QueD [Veillonella caviae]MCI7694079.1 6-carboxytetrahydropterin synthase QueD [Veillonella caviae]MDY5253090.1 6-carboxytetrahydropterin synthase QueD [Veillonella caviae]MDY5715022.1 6-carboxytetrahydropterin synthase QueD [Veillonella caviae]